MKRSRYFQFGRNLRGADRLLCLLGLTALAYFETWSCDVDETAGEVTSKTWLA
jgi:hypothetical protein